MNNARLRLQLSLGVLTTIMALGVAGFMYFEGLGLGDALYFSVISLATVGYGDIVPVTFAGRLLAMGFIVVGAGTFMTVLASVGEMLIARREQRTRGRKINIMVGVFFTNMGAELLRRLAAMDRAADDLRAAMDVQQGWTDNDYRRAEAAALAHQPDPDLAPEVLDDLSTFLTGHGDFLLRLLENPQVTDHERFTDLLWSILHLKEDLELRDKDAAIDPADAVQLKADLRRVYVRLLAAWLSCMRYLARNLDYLFRLSARQNPFSGDA